MDKTNNKPKTNNLKRQLIKKAAEIIDKDGLTKLTMRSLSNKVGVSRTAPYRHFENKNALLLAVAEEGFKEVFNRFKKINRDKSSDALSRLINIGVSSIEFALHNPGVEKLMFGQEITKHPRTERLRLYAKKAFDEFVNAVKAYQKERKISIDGKLDLANYTWLAFNGMAFHQGLSSVLGSNQFQVSGEYYGIPTLHTDKRPITVENIPEKINFAEEAIKRFWENI